MWENELNYGHRSITELLSIIDRYITDQRQPIFTVKFQADDPTCLLRPLTCKEHIKIMYMYAQSR